MKGRERDRRNRRGPRAVLLLLVVLLSACSSSSSGRSRAPESRREPTLGTLRSFLVVDEAGRPLDGRLVLVATPQYEEVDLVSSFEIRAGRVDFEVLPDLLQLACFVELPGDARPRLCWVANLGGTSPDPAPLIEMEVPGADMKISGQVVDAISKEPITAGQVELSAGEFARGSELTRHQAIRPDGTLRFEGQTHGNWWVTVRAPGYAPTKYCAYQMGIWEEDRGNNPPLYPGRELRWRALDLDPARRWEIGIQWKNANQANHPIWRFPIEEAVEGRFVIPCAVPAVVELYAEGAFSGDYMEIPAGDAPVSIVLRPSDQHSARSE